MKHAKIFGKGANGLGTGADLDIENYNAMISADIRVPAMKLVNEVVDIRCWQLFGRKIPDLQITWKPLRVLSEKEQQEINTSKINAYMQLLTQGVLTKRQVAEKLVNENIISLTEEELKKISDEIELPDEVSNSSDFFM